MSTQTMIVSGGAVAEATISGLLSSTNYSIEVAAVNSAGTGVYSGPVVALTDSKSLKEIHTRTHICTYICMCKALTDSKSLKEIHTRTHTCTYICMCKALTDSKSLKEIHTHTHTCTYVCMHKHTHEKNNGFRNYMKK